MMSGPEPTLAATAAFGRISSQLSLSMRTSMPVASVNFLVLASHAVSSPATKGDQRVTRSEAPSSGLYFSSAASWARALPAPIRGNPAAPTARPALERNRSSLEIMSSSSACYSFLRGLSAFPRSTEPLAGLGVEQVDLIALGREPDRLAR